MTLYDIGKRLFAGTPIERYAATLYFRADTLLTGTTSIPFYRVRSLPDPFEDYWIGMDHPHNGMLQGRYERPVMERFASVVTPGTDVWEIGARWGYYSYAAWTAGANVTACEADPRRVSLLHATRYANDAGVTIRPGIAGREYELNEYEPPDVCVMDIEGAESSVLKTADLWLHADTEFLIEVHGPVDGDTYTTVFDVLESSGRDVEEIYVRHEENRHVHARPVS